MNRTPASRILAGCLAAFLLLNHAMAAAAPPRLVAIGDVHGAYEELVALLQRTGLIDGNRRWEAGSTILVQTGDLVDRGSRMRDCLDLIMDLERQAEKQRGKVIRLLGNHEAMNIMGDLRYVTDEIYRSFATAQSAGVRERAYRDYLAFLAAHRAHAHTKVAGDDASRQKWMEEHPPGFFEYCDALSPKGRYGSWLRQHRVLAQVGDGLFVHAGLNPMLPFRTVADLDSQVRAELARFDSIRQSLSEKKVIWRYMKLEEVVSHVVEELKWIQAQGYVEDLEAAQQMQSLLGYTTWMAVSPDGPLWYRGLVQEPEEKLAGPLGAMLARLKARYLVSGHTVQSVTGIVSRFDNRVFLIDTGMLKSAYQGRASALEIQNGRFTAYYLDGEPQVLGSPSGGDVAPPSAAELRNRIDAR